MNYFFVDMVNFNTDTKHRKQGEKKIQFPHFLLNNIFFEKSTIIWKSYLCISALPEGYLTPIF